MKKYYVKFLNNSYEYYLEVSAEKFIIEPTLSNDILSEGSIVSKLFDSDHKFSIPIIEGNAAEIGKFNTTISNTTGRNKVLKELAELSFRVETLILGEIQRACDAFKTAYEAPSIIPGTIVIRWGDIHIHVGMANGVFNQIAIIQNWQINNSYISNTLRITGVNAHPFYKSILSTLNEILPLLRSIQTHSMQTDAIPKHPEYVGSSTEKYLDLIDIMCLEPVQATWYSKCLEVFQLSTPTIFFISSIFGCWNDSYDRMLNTNLHNDNIVDGIEYQNIYHFAKFFKDRMISGDYGTYSTKTLTSEYEDYELVDDILAKCRTMSKPHLCDYITTKTGIGYIELNYLRELYALTTRLIEDTDPIEPTHLVDKLWFARSYDEKLNIVCESNSGKAFTDYVSDKKTIPVKVDQIFDIKDPTSIYGLVTSISRKVSSYESLTELKMYVVGNIDSISDSVDVLATHFENTKHFSKLHEDIKAAKDFISPKTYIKTVSEFAKSYDALLEYLNPPKRNSYFGITWILKLKTMVSKLSVSATEKAMYSSILEEIRNILSTRPLYVYPRTMNSSPLSKIIYVPSTSYVSSSTAIRIIPTEKLAYV